MQLGTIRREFGASRATAFTVPACDSSEDITDLWAERTDPENILGQVCVAHYLHNVKTIRAGIDRRNWETVYLPELVALTVEGGDAGCEWKVDLPQDMALAVLGEALVADLERSVAERAQDGEAIQ